MAPARPWLPGRLSLSACLLAPYLLLSCAFAHAQVRSSPNYAITVDQINSGGGAASSANFTLRGTVGQPFNTAPMSSANYANRPGFQAASPSPFLQITPIGLNFANQAVGTTSVSRSVTLFNAGNVLINLGALGFSGTNAGEFSQSNVCGASIGVAAGCLVNVFFTPAALGTRTGSLDITSNAPQNVASVGLTGTGTGVPDIDLSATTLSFSTRPVGSASSAMSVTVANLGTATLDLTSLPITGAAAADYAIQPGGCSGGGTVAASANCLLSVVFTPSASGPRGATLTVNSNDPDEASLPIALSGAGLGVRVKADFGGDGKSDVLWRNAATGENYLYAMNGTTIAGEGYLRTVADQNWQIVGVGDFDGDGRSDVLWRNSANGDNYVYLMNGTTIAGEGYLRSVPNQSWQVAGVGDFNGDGKDDILWRNSATGENYVYLMDGTTIAGEGYIRTVADLAWQIVGIGDFDGDGKADIVWRNSSNGQNYLYPMDGTSIKASEGYLRTVAVLAWQMKAIGDFDGDGKADIFWRNSQTGENYVYPMDGTTIKPTEGYVRTVADVNWQIAAAADYDGDSKTDLFWRNASTGENYLYLMDGTLIKPSEGYTRTVSSQSWQVRSR